MSADGWFWVTLKLIYAYVRSAESGGRMTETKIYIGQNDKFSLTQLHGDETYMSVLKRVCRQYHIPFSVTLSNGGYFMETGEYVEEKSLVLTLVDVDEKVVAEVAKDLCVFFRQESVLVTESVVRSYHVREELSGI